MDAVSRHLVERLARLRAVQHGAAESFRDAARRLARSPYRDDRRDAPAQRACAIPCDLDAAAIEVAIASVLERVGRSAPPANRKRRP